MTSENTEIVTRSQMIRPPSVPYIPDAPSTEIEILDRVEYLVDRIHKCEYDKLVYLLEIYQNAYWKMEFGSFEQFCKERLGYSKQYVYRCINAAKMSKPESPSRTQTSLLLSKVLMSRRQRKFGIEPKSGHPNLARRSLVDC